MNDQEATTEVRFRGGSRDGRVIDVNILDDGSPRRWVSFINPDEYYSETDDRDGEGRPVFEHKPELSGPLSD